MLTLEEASKKAGSQSARVEYLGRLGKVDLGQMEVALGYYEAAEWWMQSLPEFDQAHADLCHCLHIRSHLFSSPSWRP